MRDRSRYILTRDSLEIPYRYEDQLIFLEGDTPNGPITIEFDTCTWPNSVRGDLSKERNWRQGGRVKSEGVGGEHLTTETEIPAIDLPGLKMTNLFCLTDPLKGPGNPDLMLGARLLKDLVAEVDYGKQVIRFTMPARWQRPQENENTLVFPMEMVEKVLPVLSGDISISHQNVKTSASYAMLDTGNNSSVLVAPDIAEALQLKEGAPGVSVFQAGGYGGEQRLYSRVVESLKIGPIELENVPVYAMENAAGTIFAKPGWINLGNGILENFAVTWSVPYSCFVLRV